MENDSFLIIIKGFVSRDLKKMKMLKATTKGFLCIFFIKRKFKGNIVFGTPM